MPGLVGQVRRASQIIVRYTNEKNKQVVLSLLNRNAIRAQHEIDHLDGILFIDRAQGNK